MSYIDKQRNQDCEFMLKEEKKPEQQNTSLGKDVVFLTTSKVLTLCISLLSVMLLSRFCTFEEYGTYSQILLVVTLFSSVFMLGLPSSINYFLARAETKEEEQRFLSVYYTLNTLCSLIMGLALVLIIPLIEAFFDNYLIRGFAYFLALYPWANVIFSSVENLLVVYHKTKFLIVYRLINSILLLLAIIIPYCLGWGFRGYMFLYLSVFILFALSVYVIANRLCGSIRLSVDMQWIRVILAFSLPMGLAAIVGTLNIEIDKLLIGFMMDTESLAIYTNASKELPLTIVATSITAVLLPQMARLFSKGNYQGAVELWGYATELSFIILCLFVMGIFVYAEDVMSLLYSEKYLLGISVFRVYILVLLLRCTYFGIILNALGKTRNIFYCSIASLLLNVILNPALYYLWGMIGPAIATLISMFVVLIAQLLLSAKCTGISFKMIFPWRRLGSVFFVNLVFAAVFAVLKFLLPLDLWLESLTESLLLGFVWALIYLGIMKNRIAEVWHCLNK